MLLQKDVAIGTGAATLTKTANFWVEEVEDVRHRQRKTQDDKDVVVEGDPTLMKTPG